jgi:hypothetical protein
MKNSYNVLIKDLSRYTDKVCGTIQAAELTTDTLYFKKITLADLTDNETDTMFKVRDLIAKKQSEYYMNLALSKMDKIESLSNLTNNQEPVAKEEPTVSQILELGKSFLQIGISSKEIIDLLKPIYGKFVFVDQECNKSLKTNTDALIKQLDLDYVNVYLFLLAISI